ncbi:MAG: BrxA/BrxB family bacilliredoxin [Bacilli bacterium]
MAYDSPFFLEIIQPMREELTQVGFQELRTPEAVEQALEKSAGTTLIVVNSICGCAAGIARPAVAAALAQAPAPDHLVTVFAGQDVEATKKARTYFTDYPPSSPSIGLMKDGRCLHLIERRQIEGHSTDDVTEQLIAAMQEHFV